jgi:peroxiredoxin
MVEIGVKVPDFILKETNQNNVRLKSFLGIGLVLLIFYRGDWCHICVSQIADFSRNYKEFEKINTQILAISTDSVKAARRTAERSEAKFPILIDENGETMELYGVLAKKREFKDFPALVLRKKRYAVPSLIILDKNGVVRFKYVGKSFTDRPRFSDILKVVQKLSMDREDG